MTFFQIILLFALAAGFLLYWKLFQNRFLNRFILVLTFIAMSFFVVRPEVSTKIANWLGVGRGTDLILYFAIVILIFVLLMMYAKIKRLEEMVTTLLREKAITESSSKSNAE